MKGNGLIQELEESDEKEVGIKGTVGIDKGERVVTTDDPCVGITGRKITWFMLSGRRDWGDLVVGSCVWESLGAEWLEAVWRRRC